MEKRQREKLSFIRPPSPEPPKRNTAIYNAIRWWGRKPWSIVRKYIENYTKKGDVVFDPFAGCGVVAIESLKSGRKTIYDDLNPLAHLIARTLSRPTSIADLSSAVETIIQNLTTKEIPVLRNKQKEFIKFSWLYSKYCPRCRSEGTIREIVWSNLYEPNSKPTTEQLENLKNSKSTLTKLAIDLFSILKKYGKMKHEEVIKKYAKPETVPELFLRAFELLSDFGLITITEEPILRFYECNCKKTKPSPDKDDLSKIHEIETIEPLYYYPKQELRYPSGERFLKQRKVWSVDKLFTKRNLIALSILRHEIEDLQVSEDVKDCLRLCFAAILEHVSKMERPNKKGWGVETYWISPVFLEQNILHVFMNRFETMKKACKESLEEIGDFFVEAKSDEEIREEKATVLFLKEDARKLPLSDRVANYVFTDPPYGETIQYLELSFMQSTWLALDSPFEKEIIVNPKQNKNADIYRDMLTQAFIEIYRILDYNSYMTVTFHSAEIKYWNALMYAIQIAGFEYVDALYQPPSREYTDFIHTRDPGRMSGDIYVTFFKQKTFEKIGKKGAEAVKIAGIAHNLILPESRKIICEHGGTASFDQLVRAVTLFLLNRGLLHYPEIRDLDYESLFDKYLRRIGRSKIWSLREGEKLSPIDFIPLDKRIEWIIQSVFNEKDGKAQPHEILAAIYTNLRNAKTPESKEIFDVVRELANSEQVNGIPFWVMKERRKTLTEFMGGPAEQGITKEELTDASLNHDRMIKVLAELGQHMGYDVWIGEREQNENPDLKKYLTVTDLQISGVDQIVLERLREVDVVWLMRKTIPAVLLEVEHTTNIRSGIERTSNIFKVLEHLQVKVVIVIPDGKLRHFKNVVKEPVFKEMIASHGVYSATYSTIAATYDQMEHEYTYTLENWIAETSKKVELM